MDIESAQAKKAAKQMEGANTSVLHCQRANYLAGIWKRSVISQSSIPSSVYHGWNPDKSLTWCTDIFPEEVESILMVYS